MTDAARARDALPGHTLALCRGEECIVSDLRGIAPMLSLIGEGKDLRGWSAADVVVGKAAALLFVYAGIAEVYAGVLSDKGAAVLEERGIPYSCGGRAPYIVNRQGDGVCPMERAVEKIFDPAEALSALQTRLAELRVGQGR